MDSFKGVGIQVISLPGDPTSYNTLCPVFYSPDDDAPTLSTGALMATKLWSSVVEHRHNKLVLTSTSGKTFTEPMITKSKIDYVKILVHPGGKQYKQAHMPSHIIMPPPHCHAIKTRPGSPLWTWLMHLKYNHASEQTICEMVKRGHILLPKGHSKNISPMLSKDPRTLMWKRESA